IGHFKSKEPRGEFTLVIEGQKTEDRGRWTEEELQEAIRKGLDEKMSAKELSAQLAERSGWNKKDIYRLTVRM
ncbi:MAG: hypothetical protein KGZ85_02350, partial [Ignavibacterium sp.]|nr:hypothetical protein [Ignavibacterium sp.]